MSLTTCAYPECASAAAAPPACPQCRQPLTGCPHCGSTCIVWSRYCRACGQSLTQAGSFAWERRPALATWRKTGFGSIVAPPVLVHSIGFLVEDAGMLRALSLENGEVIASLPLPGPAWAAPLVDGNRLWIASGDQCRCLDWMRWLAHPQQAEEATLWRQTFPGETASLPPFRWDGRLFLATLEDGQTILRCLDPATGQLLHQQGLFAGAAAGPLAFPEALGLFSQTSIAWFQRGQKIPEITPAPHPLRPEIAPAMGAQSGLLAARNAAGADRLLRVRPGQLRDLGEVAAGTVHALSAEADGCFIASSGGLQFMPWDQPLRHCNVPEAAVAAFPLGDRMALVVLSQSTCFCSADGTSYGALNFGTHGIALGAALGQRALLVLDGTATVLHWTRQDT